MRFCAPPLANLAEKSVFPYTKTGVEIVILITNVRSRD